MVDHVKKVLNWSENRATRVLRRKETLEKMKSYQSRLQLADQLLVEREEGHLKALHLVRYHLIIVVYCSFKASKRSYGVSGLEAPAGHEEHHGSAAP